MKEYRSPNIALLWSLAIPGFGQIYNKDYLVGVLLVALEFLINTRANLNLIIFYSFRGQFWLAGQSANLQWLLFYPCVYSFAAWHAYTQALQNNRDENRNPVEVQIPSFTGQFIGAAAGGTLGVIYSYYIGPILGGLVGMGLGYVAGLVFEHLRRKADGGHGRLNGNKKPA
ncbi:MAG: hypothetical protein ABFC94_16670 [Syntrophomonas sp.]